MNGRAVVVGAWLTMIGLATIRQVTDKSKPGLPAPNVYLGSAVLFTLLFGLSGFAPNLAAVLAVGVDIGAVLAPAIQGKSTAFDSAAAFIGAHPATPPQTKTKP